MDCKPDLSHNEQLSCAKNSKLWYQKRYNHSWALCWISPGPWHHRQRPVWDLLRPPRQTRFRHCQLSRPVIWQWQQYAGEEPGGPEESARSEQQGLVCSLWESHSTLLLVMQPSHLWDQSVSLVCCSVSTVHTLQLLSTPLDHSQRPYQDLYREGNVDSKVGVSEWSCQSCSVSVPWHPKGIDCARGQHQRQKGM